MTALQSPRRTPEPKSRRWGLASVPLPQQRMASVPFVLSLAVLLALGMFGLLVLNTALQDQSFAMKERQQVATQLGYRLAALEARVTEARSSSGLAVQAAKLGMVPNPYPVYLTLPDGRVVGDPTAMTGSEVPDVRYRTPEELAELAKAKAAAEKQRLKDLAEAKRKAEEKRKAAAERREREARERAEAEKKAAAKKAAEKKAAEKKKQQQAADGADR